MASYGADDDSDLEERIKFELTKVLAMETRAFRLEYALGVRNIDVPFLDGKRHPVPCTSETEFVQFWLAEYVNRVESSFQQRYPKRTGKIAAIMRRLTDKHARALFGATAYDTAKQRQSDIRLRIFSQVMGISAVVVKGPLPR